MDNHTRDKYKLYNPDSKRVIITRDVNRVDWKMTDTSDTLKMFREAHTDYLVPCIEEDTIPVSEPEEYMILHVIPDER